MILIVEVDPFLCFIDLIRLPLLLTQLSLLLLMSPPATTTNGKDALADAIFLSNFL